LEQARDIVELAGSSLDPGPGWMGRTAASPDLLALELLPPEVLPPVPFGASVTVPLAGLLSLTRTVVLVIRFPPRRSLSERRRRFARARVPLLSTLGVGARGPLREGFHCQSENRRPFPKTERHRSVPQRRLLAKKFMENQKEYSFRNCPNTGT
jgi:hypothetical protein